MNKIGKITPRILNYSKCSPGFTLVEIMFTVVFVCVIGGILASILLTGAKFWQINKAQIELQQQVRIATAKIFRDLRQAGLSTISDSEVPVEAINCNVHPTITFKIPEVNNGIIQWSEEIKFKIIAKQLLREKGGIGGITNVIATDISSVRFCRRTADMVDVVLEAEKITSIGTTARLNSNFAVHLRN